jgi:hypothetical protein
MRVSKKFRTFPLVIARISMVMLIVSVLPLSAQEARKVLTRVAPTYPATAKSMHISGEVHVDATVAADGRGEHKGYLRTPDAGGCRTGRGGALEVRTRLRHLRCPSCRQLPGRPVGKPDSNASAARPRASCFRSRVLVGSNIPRRQSGE